MPTPYRYFSENWKDLAVVDGNLYGPLTSVPDTNREWALVTSGPDNISSLGEWLIFGEDVLNQLPPFLGITTWGALYDPTNGTVSDGDIVRIGP